MRRTSRATWPRCGAEATLLSVVGDDEPGAALEKLLAGERVRTSLLRDPALPTTVKLRVIGRQQQLLRIDFETTPSHEVLAAKLADYERLAAGRRRRDPVRLRQGRPHAHRDDDRPCARRGQARARRSQGRRLRALSRRDGADAQPRASCARSIGRWKDEADLAARAREAARATSRSRRCS